MKKKISIAYSPDTDDSFMVLAMKEGLVDSEPFEVSYTTGDIQELNERALKGEFDVTAISIAAYPSLVDQYFMMSVGCSIGDGFGPAVIVTKESGIKTVHSLKGKRIAIPGIQTSAHFAARAIIGDFEAVPMNFLKISQAVKNNEVDGGILIHELQIDCEKHGFKKLTDLGTLWKESYKLPLPLGANAIKRSLGRVDIAAITKILRSSIVAGLENREATLKKALAQAKAGLTQDLGDKYISMYVNEDTLTITNNVKRAIDIMYEAGAEFGLCRPLKIDEHIFKERQRR